MKKITVSISMALWVKTQVLNAPGTMDVFADNVSRIFARILELDPKYITIEVVTPERVYNGSALTIRAMLMDVRISRVTDLLDALQKMLASYTSLTSSDVDITNVVSAKNRLQEYLTG